MAVTFVGSDVAGGNVATLAANDLVWPTVQANDVALIFWTFQNTATPTTPTGFTLVTNNDGGSGSMRTYIYRKVCSGSESGDFPLTVSAANRQSVALVVYRGVDTTTPVDGTPAVDTAHTTGTTHDNPAYTPTVNNCVILTSIHERATSIDTAWTPPTGYTERADTLTEATGNGGTITAVADDGLATGRGTSSVTPPVWTGDHATGTPNIVTYTLALRAASSGTNANAESAATTGTANDASVAATTTPDAATSTATATDPAASVAVNADQAMGTGAAFDATVSTVPATNAPAEVATATGAANDASIAITTNADAAAATGTSNDAASSVSANADAASAAGIAQAPAAAAAANVDVAAAMGSAFDPIGQVAISALAELASALGAALDASVSIGASADQATGTGSALDVTAFISGTTIRPNTGTTSRPSTGTTARPNTGTTARPSSGTTTRPFTGVTARP